MRVERIQPRANCWYLNGLFRATALLLYYSVGNHALALPFLPVTLPGGRRSSRRKGRGKTALVLAVLSALSVDPRSTRPQARCTPASGQMDGSKAVLGDFSLSASNRRRPKIHPLCVHPSNVTCSRMQSQFSQAHSSSASKGNLATTSDYGPDAYEFASGKPLTLLNGSNLIEG
jgi:hypothetical protein